MQITSLRKAKVTKGKLVLNLYIFSVIPIAIAWPTLVVALKNVLLMDASVLHLVSLHFSNKCMGKMSI